jgi:predicted RND superfamily exporter protein
MTTITLKINENTKKGKAFLEMARVFSENSTEIVLIETEDKSPYNPKFVAKINKRLEDHKSGKCKTITINLEDIWGSLNLK